MFMILFVLHDPDRLDKIVAAWENAGVQGATIMETIGIHSSKKLRVPMRYVFNSSGVEEKSNMTLMAIVPDQEIVAKCLVAIEEVIGDLEKPNTGIFASFPLTTVKGLQKSYR